MGFTLTWLCLLVCFWVHLLFQLNPWKVILKFKFYGRKRPIVAAFGEWILCVSSGFTELNLHFSLCLLLELCKSKY